VGGGVAVADWDETGVEVEFATADGGVQRTPLSQCLSVRFEDVVPARSFPAYRGQRNFPGFPGGPWSVADCCRR